MALSAYLPMHRSTGHPHMNDHHWISLPQSKGLFTQDYESWRWRGIEHNSCMWQFIYIQNFLIYLDATSLWSWWTNSLSLLYIYWPIVHKSINVYFQILWKTWKKMENMHENKNIRVSNTTMKTQTSNSTFQACGQFQQQKIVFRKERRKNLLLNVIQFVFSVVDCRNSLAFWRNLAILLRLFGICVFINL